MDNTFIKPFASNQLLAGGNFLYRKWDQRKTLTVFFMVICIMALGQRTISMKTIIDSSLATNPSVMESNAYTQQQQYLLRSSINLPPPELLVQNPTGKFYTVGVQQVFEFPTVYSTQRKIQKENIKLSQAAQKLTRSDIKYQLSILYNELQYQYQLLNLWQQQDSFYNTISTNAGREFKAGSIDFIQQSFAKTQSGQIKANLLMASANYYSTLQNLKSISGIQTDFVPDPQSTTENMNPVDTGINDNINLLFARQQLSINEKKLQLEKHKTLPGFTIAYLNQGEKNTVFENRFYAGLRIPLWFWQYKGNISAARSVVEASQYNSEAQVLKINMEIQSTYLKHLAYKETLLLYKSDILPQAMELTNASKRFYTSGNTSYIDYLRNLNEANNIQKNYWETLKNYNQSIIYMQYLSGKL